ncbi:MFS transporter [Sinorhizobium meliloti]|uniref:MFS transporter n=1 Tax=Rhizobium meliloti TaxID=382 RepID=UPI0001E4B648|nr:MFS transporter [Sinorhizobium meliloti]AEG57966.1 major facilitator superfamily MFS_1 [Sinorhizobium meliloti AK83]MDE4586617.1 MFS transporter [Sinorhizobium meliloti]RVK43584.1 MFS transporter [Sinorhizobium meliloti]RVM64858.1 MFS transporter [Sinorhizobium meliloti]RVN61213.1 MFS transporter [Sinorhizobium meliloti]
MFDFARDNLLFIRKNTRWIGAGFLLTLFSSFGQTFFIGLSGNELRNTFHLSGGEFGGLYMLATLASAVTLPWLGRTLDLMPGWKVVRFSMAGLALACVLIAFAPNIAVLALAIYLLRLFGQGMMTEIALTEVGRWFVANRGRAMALITQGQQVGSAILPAAVVGITQLSGSWRAGWFVSAAAVVLIGLPAIVSLMRVERLPHSHEAKAARLRAAREWTRGEVIRDPILYILLAGTLAPAFIGTVIFFHQDYLIELREYDPLVFAAAYPVMSIATFVFGLVCGHLIDRFGALRLLPFFLIPLAVASAGVALITPVWGIYAFMLLLGISNGFTFTLLGALWPEVYGLANLGGIRAITVAAMVLATAVGPGVTGALIDAGIALTTQMLWLAGWCLVASFLLAFAARKVQGREAAQSFD